MIYTDMTKKAIKVMYEAHNGVTDKAGLPYVFHPYEVASKLDDEVSVTVALLHDVVEDTKMTFEGLLEKGFPTEVIEILKLLTHDKKVPYMDYIAKIKTSPIATKVKLADLTHNMDLNRIDNVTEEDLERIEKYKKAYTYLKEN